MSGHFFDLDDGDFAHAISDNMALDSGGNFMMRMTDNMAMDMDSSVLHIISGWNQDDKSNRSLWDDEDDCVYQYNNRSRNKLILRENNQTINKSLANQL